MASAKADFLEKSMDADINEDLAKSGLISNLELRQSRVSAEEADKLHQIEIQRLEIDEKSIKARIDAKQGRAFPPPRFI